MAKKWQKISSLLEVEKIETQDGGSFLLEEHMDTIDAKLESNETEIDGLKSKADSLAEAVQTAEQAKQSAEANLATANDEIASLKSAADAKAKETGDQITALKADLDMANDLLAKRSVDGNPLGGGTGGDAKSGAEKIAEMPHIIEAKNYLKNA